MASSVATMPRRLHILCILGVFLQRGNAEMLTDTAASQAALQGASGARRPHMRMLRNHFPPNNLLVIELYRAPWRRRRRRCRTDGSSGVSSVCLWGPVQKS